MVMIKPSMKPMKIMTHSFLVFVMQVPTRSPMGVMDISTPRENRIIPTIRSTAPTRNAIRIPGEMGAMLKQRTSTIPMTGSTAFPVSTVFSLKIV